MENELLYKIYHAYAGELSLYLYSICKDRDLAGDLLQEVFLKAILSLPSDHTNFRAWLYRVARNLCYNHLRDRKREELIGSFTDEGTTSGVPDPATALAGGRLPLDELLERERNRRLYEGILRLSPTAAQVITMQYFGGLSQKEIASVLGISPGNVRVIALRAREQLRTYMEPYERDAEAGDHGSKGGKRDEL